MTFPFPPTRFGATTIDLDGFRILLNALLVAFRFMQGCAFFPTESRALSDSRRSLWIIVRSRSAMNRASVDPVYPRIQGAPWVELPTQWAPRVGTHIGQCFQRLPIPAQAQLKLAVQ